MMNNQFRDGRLYFYLLPASEDGPIVKIGFTCHLGDRFEAHDRMFGGRRLASIKGTRRTESEWRQRFKHLLVLGTGMRELFALTPELDFAIVSAVNAGGRLA